jgi:hypothetical protein
MKSYVENPMKPPRAIGKPISNPNASGGRAQDHGGGNGTVPVSLLGSTASTQRASTTARAIEALRIIATAGPMIRREPLVNPAVKPTKKRTPPIKIEPILVIMPSG